MERINFHFSVLVILFVSAAILGAISVASENREHNKISEEKEVPTLKIVAFGNSITAVRSNVQEVFAQRLPALLKDIGIEAIVVNAGIGGSHSGRLVDNDRIKVKHALDRFESAVLDEKPDLVIIGFGHNDSHIDSNQPDGESRIPLEAYRDNLVYMIGALRKINSKIILVAPSPIAQPQRPAFQNARLAEYAGMARAIAAEYKTGLADNSRLFLAYDKDGKDYASLLTDGVHPNDEGHRMIAENMVVEIAKIMKVKIRTKNQ